MYSTPPGGLARYCFRSGTGSSEGSEVGPSLTESSEDVFSCVTPSDGWG